MRRQSTVMIYRLIFLTGSMQGQRITVEKTPMVFGRAADCAVVLDDEEVAQKHAAIEHSDNGLHIRDVGTMNKILVNGREVREGWLKHGDEIELGRTHFLVQAVVAAEGGIEDDWIARRKRRLKTWTIVAATGVVVAMVIGRLFRGGEGKTEEPGTDETLKPAAEPMNTAAQVSTGVSAVAIAPTTVSGGPVAGTGSVNLMPVTEEIRNMRRDLTDIRQTMQQLAARQTPATNKSFGGPTATVAVVSERTMPARPPAPVPAGAGGRDMAGRIEVMMAEARRLASSGSVPEADKLLDAIQKTAPDYLAAYEERAPLFEQRGMPELALEQWQEILRRGATGTLGEKARAEALRLQAGAALAGPLKRKIRIATLDQQKFQESEEYAEMRVVNIGLEALPDVQPVDSAAMNVQVQFFDRSSVSGVIAPSRAVVSKAPLKPEGAWAKNGEKNLRATYVVARAGGGAGYPVERPEQYYGYVVKVSYRGELQDIDARPRSLLGEAAKAGASPR